MMRLRREGSVLIEVLVALSILSLAGVSLVGHLAAILEGQATLLERASEFRRAERLLTATSLLSETELQLRLGVRTADEFLVWVDRPEPSLFRIAVSPSARPATELLVTLVHRRDGGNDDS